MKALSTLIILIICVSHIAIGKDLRTYRSHTVDAENFSQRLNSLGKLLNLPGFSSCVIHNDSIIWTKNFGYSNIEDSILTTSNTVYHCASLTKPITSTVILQLMEDQKLGLNDLVLPDLLPILKQYGIKIDKGIGEIKIKHLLSHTSDNPPGTYFRYDGDKFSLLTQIIDKKSNESFSNLVLKMMSEIGLENTIPVNYVNTYPNVKKLMAKSYGYDSLNLLIPGKYATQFNASTGLISSVLDMARFNIALDNEQIINSESLYTAYQPYNLKNGTKSNYGLGWFVEYFHGTKLVWHYGYGYNTSGIILKVPEYELTFIIMSNSNRLCSPFALGLPQISVLESPFALCFLETFLSSLFPSDKITKINYDDSYQTIINKISSDKNMANKKLAGNIMRSFWAIANVINDSVQQEKFSTAYNRLFFVDSYGFSKQTELVDLFNIAEKYKHSESFNLAYNELIRIFAVADGGYCNYLGMYDNVYIYDINNKKEVWRMTPDYTECAGGHPRNRKADLILNLPAGDYKVFFDNSNSPYDHYFNHWEAFPPTNNFWGIKLTKINAKQ